MRIGVVGLGYWGPNIVRNFLSNKNVARVVCCALVSTVSTIFGVYNHISAEKQIEIYPFHKHEVPYDHREAQYRVMMEVLQP